jgi:hypothetical protein
VPSFPAYEELEVSEEWLSRYVQQEEILRKELSRR